MLILTKIKVMKEPFSRRLKTWNNDVFVSNCPFGCGVEDDEEHDSTREMVSESERLLRPEMKDFIGESQLFEGHPKFI